MPGAGWWREVTRMVLVLASIVILGWLFGLLVPALLLALCVVLAVWIFQLRRALHWIRSPEREPPEATGVWGEIFDRLYHLRRRDREERNRLESAVNFLRDSLASLKNAAVIIEPDGSINWCNSASKSLLGLEYPRDRGQHLPNLVRSPRFHQYLAQGDFSQSLVMECPRDAAIKLLIEVSPFGEGSRLLFARDITREEQLEETRRDFVANVSHELRTPLTVITGYLHTLLDSSLQPEDVAYRPAQQMRQQAHRMENLLKDLLWLSRLESLEPEDRVRQPVDLAALLAEIRSETLAAEPERTVEMSIETNQRVTGDPSALHSAVSNLVRNAIKYTAGAVRLRYYEHGDSVCVEVADEGPGIDPVHLPRLTERFYRVEKSRSMATGGTGLGLAIVKHILAGHGGHLDIDSHPRQGSRFTCVLPLS